MDRGFGVRFGLNYDDYSHEISEEIVPDPFSEVPEDNTILGRMKSKKYLVNDPEEDEIFKD